MKLELLLYQTRQTQYKKKKNYSATSLVKMDDKIFNKVLAQRI